MKFKNYLETITGIGIYPMVSLLMFFCFFTLLTIWVLRVNKKYINNMKEIPFSGDESKNR